MKIINEQGFDQEIANGVVLVDFYADWCGPCKMATPVLEQLSQKYNGKAEILKLNVDNAQQISMRYGVQSIPTMILFKNGQEVDRQVGFMGPAPIEAMLNKQI